MEFCEGDGTEKRLTEVLGEAATRIATTTVAMVLGRQDWMATVTRRRKSSERLSHQVQCGQVQLEQGEGNRYGPRVDRPWCETGNDEHERAGQCEVRGADGVDPDWVVHPEILWCGFFIPVLLGCGTGC